MHRCRPGQRLTRACWAASASLPHSRGVRTVRSTRAHMCPIHRITYLVHLVKVPPATESSVPAMKCAVPRAQNRVKTTVDRITFSRGRRGFFSSEERHFLLLLFLSWGVGENACRCLLPDLPTKTLLDRRARPHPVKRSPQLNLSYDRNQHFVIRPGARSSRWRVKSPTPSLQIRRVLNTYTPRVPCAVISLSARGSVVAAAASRSE